MAQVYTDTSKAYGRERYSGPAWMGAHGTRAVDLAWRDKGHGVSQWDIVGESFPADLRDDAKNVYETALQVMRTQQPGTEVARGDGEA